MKNKSKKIQYLKHIVAWLIVLAISGLFVYGLYGIIFDYIRYMK